MIGKGWWNPAAIRGVLSVFQLSFRVPLFSGRVLKRLAI